MAKDNFRVARIEENGQSEKVLIDAKGRVVRRDQLSKVLQRQQEDSARLTATAAKLAKKEKKAVDSLVTQTVETLGRRVVQTQRFIERLTNERDRLSQGDADSVDKLVTATTVRLDRRRTHLAEAMDQTERLVVELDAGGQ